MTTMLVLLGLLAVAWGQEVPLPDQLKMGFATAAYQIEGGWNADGKGESVWDVFTHTRPDMIFDHSTGDISSDSYHKYKEDVQLLKSVNAQMYRFSIAWSRILPTGFSNAVNQPGIDYYRNLIAELKANGIEPLVTMFHWDIPQPLQLLGGWANPRMADYFLDYADVLFKNLGSEIKLWSTFNEPLETCRGHYGLDVGAPALNMPGIVDYLCAHTVLQAHAKAYHLYDDQYRADQGGQVGIVLNGGRCQPKTNSTADKEAAERACQFQVGWFANPIFSAEGDYPAVMRQRVDANSQAEGRPRSRLPVFTPQEVQSLKGTADFLGVNHYTTWNFEQGEVGANPSFDRDSGAISSFDDAWPSAASGWLRVVPWGIRDHVNWIKDHYGNPTVYITENGFSDYGELDDQGRIGYFDQYLRQLVLAITEDGCNIQGYTAWSIVDNFEWRRGFTEKFGIVSVNFNSPNRTRSEKSSTSYFRDMLTRRVIPDLSRSKYTPRQ